MTIECFFLYYHSMWKIESIKQRQIWKFPVKISLNGWELRGDDGSYTAIVLRRCMRQCSKSELNIDTFPLVLPRIFLLLMYKLL